MEKCICDVICMLSFAKIEMLSITSRGWVIYSSYSDAMSSCSWVASLVPGISSATHHGVPYLQDMGTLVMGKLESGTVMKGLSLLLMPNRVRMGLKYYWGGGVKVPNYKLVHVSSPNGPIPPSISPLSFFSGSC